MATKKCLWDESHVFEINENEEFKSLCKNCYFNIFTDTYKKVMSWDDFEKEIENIKKTHKHVVAIDTYYKNNIMKLATSNPEEEAIEMSCLICDTKYPVKPKETWRYLCPVCYKKCYLQLKQNRSGEEIRNIILSLKAKTADTNTIIEKLIEIAKED